MSVPVHTPCIWGFGDSQGIVARYSGATSPFEEGFFPQCRPSHPTTPPFFKFDVDLIITRMLIESVW